MDASGSKLHGLTSSFWSVVLSTALLVLACGGRDGGGSGRHWSDPRPLAANAATDSGEDSAPTIVTDGAGSWLAVWHSNDGLAGTIGTDWDILVARSTDAGASWSAPRPLNSNAATDSGDDGLPAITTDGAGTWLAAWESTDTLSGTIGADFDVLVARSTDAGATWSAPQPVNTNAATDSGGDGDPTITTDGAGSWLVVWNSTDTLGGMIGADWDILVARSTDAGASWSAPRPVNTNASADSGEDGVPAITTDGAGTWLAAWESTDTLSGTIGADFDVLVARSTDVGASWSAPRPVNTNAFSDSGIDGGPSISTDGAGSWLAAWHSNDTLGGTIGTDYDVLVARSTDAGASWSAPRPLNTNASADSGDDGLPALTSDGPRNFVAVWESSDALGGTIGTDFDILRAHSGRAGASWSAPRPLNNNASTDSQGDGWPSLATDRAGRWVVVWLSGETLGDSIGADLDILVSRF